MNLHDAAMQVLQLRDPTDKVRATADTAARWRAGELTLGSPHAAEPLPVPGRPDKPELVAPRALAQRGLGTPAGSAAFLHAVAHIEFNAINLGWDAVYRFRDVPRGFYDDWVSVADDEAAVPDRLPFTQLRALDSTTAISLAIMWSGLSPAESRKDLHSAPLLWEYLSAAHLHGTYFTSQNLLFGNSGTWLEGLPIDRRVSATEIDPQSTYETGADDGILVDHVISHLDGLAEPRVDVVHLSNTHFPYKVDPRYTPFQPQEEATGPGYETQIMNRY